MRPSRPRSPRCVSRSRPLAGWAAVALVLAAHTGCVVTSDESLATVRSEIDEITGASEVVTWSCTATPCPWGDAVSNPAIAWPASTAPVATRLGYTASPAPYLPADSANGATLSITSGTASLFVGQPSDDSHRWLAAVSTGESYQIAGLAAGEVLSVQSDAGFGYHMTSTVTDPPPPDAIAATPAFWRCNVPECTGGDWTGAVIGWPAWAAYQSNDRSGDQSRSVFAADGAPLYPYMAAWAQGCEVTAESGTVLIIEWQRGTDSWRQTALQPRQSHVIDLVAPEDSAMIETYDGMTGFSVSLRNCTPQPISP